MVCKTIDMKADKRIEELKQGVFTLNYVTKQRV